MKAMQENQENIHHINHVNGRLADVVRKFGNPVSALLLTSPYSYFQVPNIEGIIGYERVNNCAVVIGEPICSGQDLAALTHAFHDYCQKNSWKIVYLLASGSYADWALQNGCRSLIQVGEELRVDPASFHQKQKLRWKVNQSLRNGVVIKEYTNSDQAMEFEMKETIKLWLKTKNGPQIYLGSMDFLENLADKRIFYAIQEGKIVGLAILSKIDKFHGWVLAMFFGVQHAPIGITEHLLSTIMDTLANEDCHFLCLGVVSGNKLSQMVGMNFFSRCMAHFIFNTSRWLFHLDARKIYFNKYQPTSYPTYILCSEKLGLSELMGLRKALNVSL
jgi:lysylphosphatidylglycerol synthetase-like protein (DUF2156 family)